MGKFEKYVGAGSSLMSFLTRVADLIALNLLTLLMCVPIVTAGASLTAMYTIVGRMARGEHYYVFSGFFKAFKENFRQATAEWLILLGTYCFLAFDLYIMFSNDTGLPRMVLYLLVAIAILVFVEAQLLFPVQSRFVNPVKTTFKTTVMMATANFPKAIVMAMCWSIPLVILYKSLSFLPLFLFLGVSVPGIIKAYLYTPIFAKFEPKIEDPVNDMDFRVRIDGEEDDTEITK